MRGRTILFIIYDCEMTTRHTLTLSEKIQLIRENEQKFSYRTLANKYKISTEQCIKYYQA